MTRAYTSNAKSTVPTHMATAKRTLRTVMVLLDGIAAEAASRRGNERFIFGDSGDLDLSVGSTEEFVATYARAGRRLYAIPVLKGSPPACALDLGHQRGEGDRGADERAGTRPAQVVHCSHR